MRAGASEVYVHGMPGGQYTNLREQARALGIADARWPEVAHTYADVNAMFGDIVKVTPTSKVVGDLALLMVSSGISREQVLDPDTEVAFPESVVQLFRGDLGQSYGGFPAALQRKVLKGAAARSGRPGATLPPVDLAAERARIQRKLPRPVTDEDLASYLMYPRVWLEYARDARAVRGSCDPADAGVLLRHGAGAGDQRRHRARQDAHRALRGVQRAARRRHAHGVLRAERPAALGARRGRKPGGAPRPAAQGRGRQSGARRGADARHGREHRRAARAQGRPRGPAADAGGDEDGDRGARDRRRPRWPRCWCEPGRAWRRATCS